MRKLYFVLPALLALSVVGCHGSSKGDDHEPSLTQIPEEKAHLNLSLHREGPATDARILRLQVAQVEVQTKGGRWIPLAASARRVEMSLLPGASAPIVEGAELPSGDYRALRLKLGPDSTVVLANQEERTLQAPDTLQGDLVWTAQKREHLGMALLLDAHQALGRDGSLAILAPAEVTLRDLRTARTLRGVLKEAGSGKVLAGRQVTVQAPSRNGGPGQEKPMTILRTGTTDKDGAFQLDLLPSGVGYRVVAPPSATHDLALGPSFDPGKEDLLPQTVEAAPLPKGDLRTLEVPARPEWDGTRKSHMLLVERRADAAPGNYVIVETLRRERNEALALGPLAKGEYRVRLLQWGPGPVKIGKPEVLQAVKTVEVAATPK
ncbi:MAG TPA: DUF4382 domain-containing protein [Holophaga sp.]|nr:DUF4382 domain-containing protein [Holophaga sp.]